MNADIYYHGPVVIFDLDDTLIRERDFCRTGFRAIADHLINKYGSERFGRLADEMTDALAKGEPYIPLLEKALSPDLTYLLDDMLDIYGSHTVPAISPCEGVRDTLDVLKGLGFRMGIITDGRSVTQRAKIRSAKLEEYFAPDMIYISEEVKKDKSSPDSFVDIVRKFPEASKFIYIGDNPQKDILTPSLLGWETVLLAFDCDNVHPHDNIGRNIPEPTYRNILFSEIPLILSSVK